MMVSLWVTLVSWSLVGLVLVFPAVFPAVYVVGVVIAASLVVAWPTVAVEVVVSTGIPVLGTVALERILKVVLLAWSVKPLGAALLVESFAWC